jgi:hypothetical protein
MLATEEDEIVQAIQLNEKCLLARLRLSENNIQSIRRPATRGIGRTYFATVDAKINWPED